MSRAFGRRELLGLAALGAVGACSGAVRRATAPTPAPTQAPPDSAAAPAAHAAPQARRGHAGAAREVVHGARSGHAVALTFHGAGDPALARRLLTDAHRRGAVVTVLAVGTWLRDHPDMARLVHDTGHELGNHTEHHLAMRHLTPSRAYDEVARCADRLYRLTGSAGRWFRPSGTPRATPTILAAAGRAGYRLSVAYDVDPLDYRDPGPAAVRARVAKVVRPGSIVSLHLGHPGTLRALPGVLDDLATRRLRPVGLSRLPGIRP